VVLISTGTVETISVDVDVKETSVVGIAVESVLASECEVDVEYASVVSLVVDSRGAVLGNGVVTVVLGVDGEARELTVGTDDSCSVVVEASVWGVDVDKVVVCSGTVVVL
jgi:hypothetical protein